MAVRQPFLIVTVTVTLWVRLILSGNVTGSDRLVCVNTKSSVTTHSILYVDMPQHVYFYLTKAKALPTGFVGKLNPKLSQ